MADGQTKLGLRDGVRLKTAARQIAQRLAVDQEAVSVQLYSPAAPVYRDAGGRQLRTACLLSRIANLRGEACQELGNLYGLDEAIWPNPTSDPVVQALQVE